MTVFLFVYINGLLLLVVFVILPNRENYIFMVVMSRSVKIPNKFILRLLKSSIDTQNRNMRWMALMLQMLYHCVAFM